MKNLNFILNSSKGEPFIIKMIKTRRKYRELIFSRLNESHFQDGQCRDSFKKAKERYLNEGNMNDATFLSSLRHPECDTEYSFTVQDGIKDIIDNSVKRRVYAACKTLSSECISNEISADEAGKKFLDIGEAFDLLSTESEATPLKGLINEVWERYKKVNSGISAPGIPWGIDCLSGVVFNLGELIILAARPSVGKTAFSLSCMLGMSKKEIKCGMVCFEMSGERIARRMVSIKSGIPYSDIRDGVSMSSDNYDRYTKAVAELRQDKNISLCCGKSMDELTLKYELTRMVREDGCKVIFVDYVQNVEGRGSTKEIVDNVIRICERLISDLGISIILLAQINRSGEDEAPKISQLKDSGNLEQAADIVLMLDRKIPGRPFGKLVNGKLVEREYDRFGVKMDMEKHCAVIVGKNRDGKTGIKLSNFNERCMGFQ